MRLVVRGETRYPVGGFEQHAGNVVGQQLDFLVRVVDGSLGKGERIRQVLEAAERLVRAVAGDDLMKIDRLVVATQAGDVFRRGLELQRRAEVQLAEADAGPGDAIQGLGGLFELNGEMAGVVVQADELEEIAILRVLIEVEAEELQRLAARLKQTERFRLQTEVQIVPALFGHLFDVLAAEAQVGENGRELIGADVEGLVRAGQGAHAAAHACGQKLSEEVKEQVRVVEPLLCGPVRLEDLLLHPRAVKGAVGEAIDGEDVAAVLIQPAAEFIELARLVELLRRLGAETQANAIRIAAADAVFDAEGVLFEATPCLLPRFAAMDVRAVAEVDVVVESHEDGGCNERWRKDKTDAR